MNTGSKQLDMLLLNYKHGGEAKLRARCLEITRERYTDDESAEAVAESMVRRVIKTAENINE